MYTPTSPRRLTQVLTLGRSFASFALVLLLLSGVVWWSIHGLQTASLAMQRAMDVRSTSMMLAQELRQSSQDLTQSVRGFAVTGNAAEAERYRRIVAVRDGHEARPDGTRVSLIELMRRAGFTMEELTRLSAGLSESQSLITVEEQAMTLTREWVAAGAVPGGLIRFVR